MIEGKSKSDQGGSKGWNENKEKSVNEERN